MVLTGCSSGYQLHGRVVAGPVSSVSVVNKNDPRLGEAGSGLGGAAIGATLDPRRLNRRSLGSTASQADGMFAIPVSAAGAGFLEYEVEVLAERAGCAPAVGTFRMPGRSKWVLVTLASGQGAARSADDRYLDETLKMSEPYLRE